MNMVRHERISPNAYAVFIACFLQRSGIDHVVGIFVEDRGLPHAALQHVMRIIGHHTSRMSSHLDCPWKGETEGQSKFIYGRRAKKGEITRLAPIFPKVRSRRAGSTPVSVPCRR